MSLKDLSTRIGEMIAAYNKDLAYDEDDRVAAVQVILTRPQERVEKDKPASLYVTTRDFTAAPVEKSATEATSFSAGQTTVTYSYSTSSSIQCCADGWVGLVDSEGVFQACFPVPGACAGFPGPNRCAV